MDQVDQDCSVLAVLAVLAALTVLTAPSPPEGWDCPVAHGNQEDPAAPADRADPAAPETKPEIKEDQAMTSELIPQHLVSVRFVHNYLLVTLSLERYIVR